MGAEEEEDRVDRMEGVQGATTPEDEGRPTGVWMDPTHQTTGLGIRIQEEGTVIHHQITTRSRTKLRIQKMGTKIPTDQRPATRPDTTGTSWKRVDGG